MVPGQLLEGNVLYEQPLLLEMVGDKPRPHAVAQRSRRHQQHPLSAVLYGFAH
jgi:hypothetical protein